ncbi:uncharacterized protein MONOS_13930 [Monocercomonoides exilis]|uniref:uncharacterized protein n=1 Tax=Monocercomonoides exilis TaxID=2049356 RepID=UPI00355A59C7|nr:hypothetical protein MONOS_13930 [Monocercomonoides exilis]
MSTQDGTEAENTKKITELFDELEYSDKDAQKQKIGKVNILMSEMDKEEFKLVFTKELFDNINKMIEEKKISMDNALVLLNRIGYWIKLKGLWRYSFKDSLLCKRLKKMIEEEKKKEGKNEKLLTDLCECYFFLSYDLTTEMLSICVPCLLKVAMNKDESKEAQKEVEMALLALSNIGWEELDKEQYFNEIKEIIEYHQEHQNLTRLAYQSAWFFLLCRLNDDKSLEEVIVNELHFAREAARELEELAKNVNWKRKEEEERGKDTKNERIFVMWLKIFDWYFRLCELQNEGNIGLICSLVQVLREATGYRIIVHLCILCLSRAVENRAVEIVDLFESGAIDLILENIHQAIFDDVERRR